MTVYIGRERDRQTDRDRETEEERGRDYLSTCQHDYILLFDSTEYREKFLYNIITKLGPLKHIKDK